MTQLLKITHRSCCEQLHVGTIFSLCITAQKEACGYSSTRGVKLSSMKSKCLFGREKRVPAWIFSQQGGQRFGKLEDISTTPQQTAPQVRGRFCFLGEGPPSLIWGGSGTFNVSVDLLLRVQVVEPLQDLLQHGGNLSLIERTRPQLHTHTHTENKVMTQI